MVNIFDSTLPRNDWNEALKAAIDSALPIEINTPSSPETFVNLLNDIVNRKVLKETTPENDVFNQATTTNTKTFKVVLLNAETKIGKRTGIGSMGIVFDDPTYAIGAATNCRNPKPKVLPKATSYDDLISKRNELVLSNFRPEKIENIFSETDGFIGENPVFSLLSINDDELKKLRNEGLAAINFENSKVLVELFDKT